MVRSTKFSVTWYGGNFPEFVPFRRIQQGDHLSSYLFYLCLERLSIMLEEATRNRLLIPISFQRQIKISHIFFADDIF